MTASDKDFEKAMSFATATDAEQRMKAERRYMKAEVEAYLKSIKEEPYYSQVLEVVWNSFYKYEDWQTDAKQYIAEAKLRVCGDCEKSIPYNRLKLCDDCYKKRKKKREEEVIEVAKKNAEEELKRDIERNINQAGFRKRHDNMTFDSYKGKINPEIEKYDVAIGNNMFIHGSVGSGKTHLAVSLAREILNAGYEFKIVNAIELLQEIRQTFSNEEVWDNVGAKSRKYPATDDIVDYYSDIEVLCIDDLGVEKGSEWTIETFYLILNKRYEFERPTIVTTNFSPSELSEKLGDRIISRLIGHNAIIVKCEGDDYRIKDKQKLPEE